MKDDINNSNEKNDLIDAAIASVKADIPPQAEMHAAGERVKQLLNAANTNAANNIVVQNASANSLKLDSIDDYIAAIPDYLQKQLSPAQTLLFEEESRSSIPLRRALTNARNNTAEMDLKGDESDSQDQTISHNPTSKKRTMSNWFIRTAAMVVVAFTAFMILPKLPSLDQSDLVLIEEIQGDLFLVEQGQLTPLKEGVWIEGHQNIRTSINGGALLVLDDGSRVEVNERTQLSVVRRGSGNRIDVERGKILVEASPQGSGTLVVKTNEVLVSVTGTIFEVGHGTMGSRVAVIEGEVQVLQKGISESLLPGDQISSRYDSVALKIADEISWSRDADKYIHMLSTLSALKKDFNTVIDTAPRYSTRLLDLSPINTVAYIAVPNAPKKIAEVYDLFKSHFNTLEGMGDDLQVDTKQLDAIMASLADIGDLLGDETVVTISLNRAGNNTDNNFRFSPVILSEVDAGTTASDIEAHLQQLALSIGDDDNQHEIKITLIDDPEQAVPGELSIWLKDDLLVATVGVEAMKDMQAILAQGSSDFVGSGLHALLNNAYSKGTEMLGAVHLAKIMTEASDSENVDSSKGLAFSGLDKVQYLTAERRQTGERTSLVAELLFDGDRTGMMSWLAAPGPMASMEFFSVDSTMVAAAAFKDPAIIIEEMKQIIEDFAPSTGNSATTSESTNEAQNSIDDIQLWQQVKQDVLATLGGEFAFGLDGPLLPVPSWKVVLEVYDENMLQQNIEQLIVYINEKMATENKGASILISKTQISDFNAYQLSSQGLSNASDSQNLSYVYVDGYLVAAASMAQLENAIKYYQTSASLLTDSEFQSLLPNNDQLDFSALVFSRIGELVADLVDKIPTNLSAEQKEVVQNLNSNVSSLYSVNVKPNGFRLVQNGNADLPFSIAQLLSLQSLIEGAAENHPKSTPTNVSLDEATE